jgi:hypothetical protein
MNRNASIILAILAVLATAGCTPRKDRARLLRDVETIAVRMVNEHTGLPDFLIKVPTGFVVEWTRESRYDKYFIYNPRDSGDVQKGMAVIDVTPYPARQIPDSLKVKRSIGQMAGHDVKWTEYTVGEPGEPALYQREMTSYAPFEEIEKYKDHKNALHVFVVGSDQNLVEILTAAAETITILPRKPNL